MPMSGLSGSGHRCDDDVMSADWDPLEGPPWLTVGLVVAVLLWLAEVAVALDTVRWTPVLGIIGLVVAGVGLVAFRWLCKSWAHAFFWSALLSFAVMFGIMVSTLSLY